MTPYALVGEVLAPEPLGQAAVVVGDGKILEVARSPRNGELPPDRREVAGIICPGLVDLQINGAFGIDVGPDPDTLRRLVRKLPGTGTTSFLPTLISPPPERYPDFLEALRDASSSSGARILGAHIEGPFLSPARRGAHDPANLRPVDPGLVETLLRTGFVRVMTLAPELPGATMAAGLLREGGAAASVGHTDAAYEEVLSGIDAGFSKATHLYNAMSPLTHRARSGRYSPTGGCGPASSPTARTSTRAPSRWPTGRRAPKASPSSPTRWRPPECRRASTS